MSNLPIEKELNLRYVQELVGHGSSKTTEIFATILYILGGVSCVGLWANWKKQSFSTAISIVTVGLTVVVLYYAKQTASSGGEIRHTEIRTGGVTNSNDLEKNVDYENDDD